ncbi:MAG TPA: carboxymuconolactone decarboxylase family protein [Dehalococcoidia bacterium]|nr:carboxymuconolactone decarboxylase family protein [Dehalococcoidia bacterium]
MAVVPPLAEGDDEASRAFLERAARLGGGRALNVFQVAAHSPRLAQTWLEMMAVALSGLSLPPRLRELAVLRLFLLARVPYGFAHHVAIARRLGMAEEEVWSVRDYERSPALGELERLVLRYTDAAVALDGQAQGLARELRRHLSDGQLVELAFCIAIWSMMARLLNSLGVELEEEAQQLLPHWWQP